MPHDPLIDTDLDDRDEELRSLIRRQIEEAKDWREEHLDPKQAEASDLYMGRKLGNEQEGRSQIVATEVRDAVQSLMPSLMEVLVGPDRVVEYAPRGLEDVNPARLKTEYAHHVVMNDNRGFLTLHSAIKDALVKKIGIIKGFWEENPHVAESEYTGLSRMELDFLLQHPDSETLEVALVSEEGQPEVFEARIRRVVDDGRIRIDAIPPEEFLWSPNARCLDDAEMVCHIRDLPASELLAMGVPEDILAEAGNEQHKDDESRRARRLDEGTQEDWTTDEKDPARKLVQFADVWTYLPVEEEDDEGGKRDDDEIVPTALYHIQAVGTGYEITLKEIVEDRPFAIFLFDPEPHEFIGLSVTDYTKDLQYINSAIYRGIMDSLTLTLNPSTEVVEGQVNIKDILNPEVGRLVRVRRPGMMREVVTPFVGGDALPVLQQMDDLRERRIGQSKGAGGIDADALQSSTRAAVAATVTASKQRLQLLVRILAETGMKDLFRMVLRLLVRHQDQPRMFRFDEEFVEVNPAEWEADLDVSVNVAIGGAGTNEEKLSQLQLIAAKQEQHLQQGSPLVNFKTLRANYARMIRLAGLKPEEFFLPWGDEQQAQHEQALAAQPPKPSVEEQLVQVEMAKLQAQQQREAAELRLDAEKFRREDDRERDRLAREFVIERMKLAQTANAQVTDAQVQLMVESARQAFERDESDQDRIERMFVQLAGPAGPAGGSQPA